MNQEEIDKLNEQLKDLNNLQESALKSSFDHVENAFYQNRSELIKEIKSYLVNLSIISATIIPFSSLVFQIPESVLKVNIALWLVSIAGFIISLVIFISCFLSLINAERGLYGRLLLSYIESSMVTFLSLNKDEEETERTMKLTEIFQSNEKFSFDKKQGVEERVIASVIKRLTYSSYIFALALFFFFASIILNYLIAIVIDIFIK